jgi:hypothetical protein
MALKRRSWTMRNLATISAMMLLAAGLTGCDMPGSAPQQQQAAQLPPPPAVAPATACNCNQTAAADDNLARLPVAHHHYRHRTYGYHGSYTSQSEKSVDAYDYQSASRESDESYVANGPRNGGVVWVDGYGRGYYAGPPPTVAATMRGKRLAAWYGYDQDCPDNGNPH